MGVLDWVLRPLDWVSALSARISGLFNQERWTLLLMVLSVVMANLIITAFLLQGQDNRAIAFVILLIAGALALFVPEFSVAAMVLSGAGIFVNATYFAAGPGGGTGQRTLMLIFFAIITVRAIYEYLRIPINERPKIFTFFTVALVIFWTYFMAHVAYIYIFRYDILPPDDPYVVLGIYRSSIFRYFSQPMLWIVVLSMIILLRDIQRVKRVLFILGVVLMLSALSIVWEYFAPLPYFWKVLFQLRATGETMEGYRVREPAALLISAIGFFFAIYSLGFLRGTHSAIALIYILATTLVIIFSKFRVLWASLMVFLPFALLWKPPAVLYRQLVVLSIGALFGSALLLHPVVYEVTNQVTSEAVQRWNRTFTYGGDPTLDPSYQGRLREKEAWEQKMSRISTFQRLFGAGLEEPYGRYISLYDIGSFPNPRYRNLYVEKVSMHFPWLLRQLHIGLVGTALLALLILAFFVRAIQAFFLTRDTLARCIIMGAVGGTIATLGVDAIQSEALYKQEAFPVIMMWAFVEAIFHWKRTGQIDQEPQPAETSPV